MYFTVTTEKNVFRIKARSIQHLTQSMRSVGIKWLGIHADREVNP